MGEKTAEKRASALARAEDRSSDFTPCGAQDRAEGVFHLAGAALGGALARGLLPLLLLLDLAAQAFHFLFARGLFLRGGLLELLGGLLSRLLGLLARLFRGLLGFLACLFRFLFGRFLGEGLLAGGLCLGRAALELLLGRVRVHGGSGP